MAKRNGSQARDPVKGVKAKYQFAVTKEPLLRVIVWTDAYKVTITKIKAYRENYRRFEGWVIVLILRDIRLLEMAGLYVFGWLYWGDAGIVHKHCIYIEK